MNVIFAFASILALVNTVSAVVTCSGTRTGVFNEDIWVDGGSCTLSKATVNGNVLVKNGGNLLMEQGTIVNGNVVLTSAGSFQISGRSGTVTVNGRIEDVGGSGRFLVCGAKISSNVSVTRRAGEISIGVGSCLGSTISGKLRVTGGSGAVQVQKIQGSLSEFRVTFRKGNVDLSNSAPTDNVIFVGNGNVSIENTTVNNETKIRRNNMVRLIKSTHYGRVRVEGNTQIVVIGSIRATQVVEFIGNAAGLTITGSTIDTLKCSGNSPPIFFKDNSVIRAEGQCKNIASFN